MARALGLDIGDKRIGMALGDETGLIATPYKVYERVGWGPDVKYLMHEMEMTGAAYFVSGLPRNMDGSVGFQAQKVMDFCEKLRQAGAEVYFQDERLSTVSAHDALIEGGMHRMERKQNVDKVAAAFILQSYLDTNSNA